MATGFSVMDALNERSKAGTDESPKARFRTKDISIHKMYRNDKNFYTIREIEELAGDILMHGLKQNLELIYEQCDAGEYRIISGERRWEALKLLVSKGYREFEIATCKLTSPQDDDEEQIEIISANSYRTKSMAETIEEERRLKAALERMRAAGKKIKGYDLSTGRLRDVIASMLRMSKTKVAQIESVNNNLIPEFREELKKERLTFSAAYELSGMSGQQQREALEEYREAGELTHKDIKSMKEGRAEGQQAPEVPENVSESDTKYVSYEDAAVSYGMDMTGKTEAEGGNPGDGYEDAHPESITSLCYSCQSYSTCNVKTGTCRKCDQYINKAEAKKTKEQRYSEEQDKIDRETKRKLREREDNERMNGLPSESAGAGRKVHQIRLGSSFFEDVRSGKKPFELQKNDGGYKEGDILEIMEFAEGRETGRTVRALVTYILEDYTGLEDGYCIMGTSLLGEKDGYNLKEKEEWALHIALMAMEMKPEDEDGIRASEIILGILGWKRGGRKSE